MPVKKATKKKALKAAPNDGIDVAKESDIAGLEALLQSQPIVLVFIYADWCGHCHTYKPQWEKYKAFPGRRVPMASINEKVLPLTPLKSAKLDGYPSNVLYSGIDGSFGSFKNENGEETHAIPNARDAALMRKLLMANPAMLKRMGAHTMESDDTSDTVKSTPEANLLLEESGTKAMKDKDLPIKEMNDPAPPDTSADTVVVKRGGGSKQGGSLLDSIMRYVAEFTPSSGTRRRKRKQGTRKSR